MPIFFAETGHCLTEPLQPPGTSPLYLLSRLPADIPHHLYLLSKRIFWPVCASKDPSSGSQQKSLLAYTHSTRGSWHQELPSLVIRKRFRKLCALIVSIFSTLQKHSVFYSDTWNKVYQSHKETSLLTLCCLSLTFHNMWRLSSS